MMHPSLTQLQKEKCLHKDNFDYHSGYQQALLDVEPLLEDVYLAGFFDGEGGVYWNHSDPIRPRIYLHVSNNILAILEIFRKRFGGSVRNHTPITCYRWTATGAAASRMTNALLPFTHIKTELLAKARDKNFGLIKNIAEC